jgi:hypothetical protein
MTMHATKSRKTAAKASPDKLSKTGRKVGVELTENQLGLVSGGGKVVKVHFDT